jgi:hypothetical protein
MNENPYKAFKECDFCGKRIGQILLAECMDLQFCPFCGREFNISNVTVEEMEADPILFKLTKKINLLNSAISHEKNYPRNESPKIIADRKEKLQSVHRKIYDYKKSKLTKGTPIPSITPSTIFKGVLIAIVFSILAIFGVLYLNNDRYIKMNPRAIFDKWSHKIEQVY